MALLMSIIRLVFHECIKQPEEGLGMPTMEGLLAIFSFLFAFNKGGYSVSRLGKWVTKCIQIVCAVLLMDFMFT